MSAARVVGEQSAVEWKFLYRRPFSAMGSRAGVGMIPPKVEGAPWSYTTAVPGPRAPRLRSWPAAAAAVALAGCASARLADARDAHFRRELGTFRYEKGCLDVWPAVLELLGARGYPLRGRDRAYAGQPPGGAVAEFLGQGFETRRVEGSALYVKTGWRTAPEGESRYLVSGTPVRPSGCAVSFTLAWHRRGDPSSERQEVDWEIQRDLLERLEPDAAARIEAGAPKG